jgi:hypothetical protein
MSFLPLILRARPGAHGVEPVLSGRASADSPSKGIHSTKAEHRPAHPASPLPQFGCWTAGAGARRVFERRQGLQCGNSGVGGVTAPAPLTTGEMNSIAGERSGAGTSGVGGVIAAAVSHSPRTRRSSVGSTGLEI